MSDNWIILIPEDARKIPDLENQRQAVSRFRELAPTADKVEVKISEPIRFVDCGENFEKILCPNCGAGLEIVWWQERMDEDYDGSGFRLKSFTVPCCGSACALNELVYQGSQGFARFSLEAMNPNIGEMPKAELGSLETRLGCSLKVIYRHI